MSPSTKRFFLTVEWCNNGQRGIFSDARGNAYSKETPHTQAEMFAILDIFAIILNPQSIGLTERELHQYTSFQPLAEYSNAFGIVHKASDSPRSYPQISR